MIISALFRLLISEDMPKRSDLWGPLGIKLYLTEQHLVISSDIIFILKHCSLTIDNSQQTFRECSLSSPQHFFCKRHWVVQRRNDKLCTSPRKLFESSLWILALPKPDKYETVDDGFLCRARAVLSASIGCHWSTLNAQLAYKMNCTDQATEKSIFSLLPDKFATKSPVNEARNAWLP